MRSMLNTRIKKALSWVGKNWALLLLWALLLSVSVLLGLSRVEYSDFNPINGDFQNYNGYRRLLAGQAPFGDFFYYLGLGPLYVNTAVLWLMGSDLTHSLIATHVVSSLALGLSIYCVARCNSLSPSTSLLLTLLLQLSAAGYGDPLNVLQFFKGYDFLSYIYPGVSDRVVRSFLPFLLVLMSWVVGARWRSRGEATRAFAQGSLLGACLAWSNDFGISVFVAGCLMFALPRLKQWKTLARSIPLVLLGAAVGCFVTVSLLTWGHFAGWVDYNFRGVASYQFWYYDPNPASKFLVAGDLPINFEILCCLLLIAYLARKVISGGYTRQQAGLLFLLLTTVIAGYAYAINSGKSGLFVPANIVLYSTIFSLLIKTIEQRLSPEVVRAGKLVLFLGLVWLVALQARTTKNKLEATRGVFVPALGGVLSRYGGDLNEISQRYIHGQPIFSTYASALEVMNDQFQPTGMDYIIHVLGDAYRARYLEGFRRAAPRYVTTIREDFTQWELWVKRSNWFFYRELLRNHKPVTVTPYSVLWEKSPDLASHPQATLQAEQVSDNRVELTVRLPSAQDGIADLSFAYASHWKPNRWRSLGVRKIVSVTDGWSSEWNGFVGGYNLPEAREQINIPVRITRGEGRITLAVFPEKLTRLDVRDLTVENLLPDAPGDLKRLEGTWSPEQTTASDLTDANWERGLSRKQNVILFPNSIGNRALIVGAKSLRTNDGTSWPIRAQSSTPDWIHVEVEQLDPERMRYPNELRFSR
ncbi:hypothetical protein F0U62_08965 [Cystobacter fuscus]|uniref:hypothetical protein n=1 Tax=Cystobacter fuscus TaxID=43 RepID=UPI002B31D37B|nr:hypothetical protein F0U62_08965 [Cystobacter fuscus]